MKIIIEADSLEELESLLERITGKTSTPADCHINELPLDDRVRRCLLAEGVETLHQLSIQTDGDLLRMPNIGRKSVAEIRDVLKARGFELRLAQGWSVRTERQGG